MSIFKYFYNTSEKKPIDIKFGRYSEYIKFLDYHHDKICYKFKVLAKEVGPDPCNRHFFVEPVINFAICRNITNEDIDYIYRYYVYHQLAQHQEMTIENIAMQDLMADFIFVKNDL